MDDIKDKLRAYGKWCRQDSHGLGCKSPSEMIMKSAPHADAVELRIARYDDTQHMTDDEAMKIDRIIVALLRHAPITANCLKRRYIELHTAEEIAHKYLTPIKYGKDDKRKVSKHVANQYISKAEGFVECAIFDYEFQ